MLVSLQQGAQIYFIRILSCKVNPIRVNWKLSSASDWIMAAGKNIKQLKVVTLLGFLL